MADSITIVLLVGYVTVFYVLQKHMNKQITNDMLPGEVINLTPKMLGKVKDSREKVVINKDTGEELDPRNIYTKILVYEDEVKHWLLESASNIVDYDNFMYAPIVLMICMSCLEGIQQLKIGEHSNGNSRRFFRLSVKNLYPQLKDNDREINLIYEKVRCGLFHDGMLKGGSIFDYSLTQGIAFRGSGSTISINPKILLEDIKRYFDEYITELKNPNCITIRQNFDNLFKIVSN